MKTTLDLPDELMREVKIRAVLEDRKLKDQIAHLLRRGLAGRQDTAPIVNRVQIPLVECGHAATPSSEMTPARVARLLLEEEADSKSGSLR